MGYLGLIPGATAWEWMVASKLLPLLLLLASVLSPDVKPIFAQMKALWRALRQANERLEVFGEEPTTAAEEAPESSRKPIPALESVV